MIEFLLYLVVMGSLAAMTIVAARAVPRVSEDEIVGGQTLEQWLKNLPLQEVDQHLRKFLNKTLRRFRVVILKVDNMVSNYLDKVKEENGENGRDLPDWEELQSDKKKKNKAK